MSDVVERLVGRCGGFSEHGVADQHARHGEHRIRNVSVADFSTVTSPVDDLPESGRNDRLGFVGVLLCAVATVPFAMATTRTSWVLLGVALIIRGGALSGVNIAITAGAFADLSRDQVPAASAIVRLVQQLGGAAGTALLATVAAAVGSGTGFHAAFLWSIGLTLTALIPCLAIPARQANN